MYTLLSFATQWGSQHGGINCFNTDFLCAMGVAYYHSVQVICIVMSATDEEKTEASKSHVHLESFPYKPSGYEFDETLARACLDHVAKVGITFEPEKSVWLGHDRVTGRFAVSAAKSSGGRSAIIHHMSYDHYEAFAENSQVAYAKVQAQTELLRQADIVFAVGPLLRDAACDRLGAEKPVHMLIPGLAEIEVREAPNTFTAFMSGRLSDNAARIKQGHLGIAAFAQAHYDAREQGMPDALCRHPKLVLRGVDLESDRLVGSEGDLETELKKFAQEYAHSVVNLHALPFIQDRKRLYNDLSSATVALMPSWHEGFGLVAWEAIAAGVPLIISKKSGVYQLLEENYPGAGPGCVFPIDVRGTVTAPYFHSEDLRSVVAALKVIAQNPRDARRKASSLRGLLSQYSWSACVKEAVKALGWPLYQGSIVVLSPTQESTTQLVEANRASIPCCLLQVPVKQWRRGVGMADSMLLRAEEEVVQFDSARQPEIDALNAWIDDRQWPQAVRLMAGPGGAGKTRLALELCRQRIRGGWLAGFLDASLAVKDMATLWQRLVDYNQPLLIVLDYAETRQAALLALTRAIIKKQTSQPVRILLLARGGGEWWDNLPSKDPICEGLLSGYATSLFNLPALHPEKDGRHHAYELALASFANALDVSPPLMVPDLSSEHFERPLFIQMAALLALHGERPTTAEGLTRALLNHERRYWHRLLTPYGWVQPESLAQQLLALTTLSGGFVTPKDASAHWAAAGFTTLTGPDFSALFNTLVPLYPGKQGLQPMRPDLLGEALVAQTLLLPESAALLSAVLGKTATQSARRNALTVLARLTKTRMDVHEIVIDALEKHLPECCNDLVSVAVETPSNLPDLFEVAFARLRPAVASQVAGMLDHLVGKESVQLAGLSCAIAEFLAGKSRQKWEKKPTNMSCIAEYAGALINTALSLSIAGRDEQALRYSHESVTLLGKLYERDKKNYESGYATALNNYAGHLSDAGQDEDALGHAQQALVIRKRLADKNPDRYDPVYASSLNNCANLLSRAGQSDASLDHAREALEIVKRLAQRNPDEYNPDYAAFLNNYASHLSDAGQNDNALFHSRQSLEIRKLLAEKNHDRHDPDYAMSLNNYSNRLRDLGQNDEALLHALRALEIRKRLAQKNPDRYESDYATSLNNCASHLSDMGKNEEALKHARQALEIQKRLAQKNQDRYEPDYALCLSNYSSHLSDQGQHDDALQHARHALEIRERLFQKNCDRYEAEYARSLNDTAIFLSGAGQSGDALYHAHQAVERQMRLAQKNPDRFEPEYAMYLNTYSSCLCDAGKIDDALQRADEARTILMGLTQKYPDVYHPSYASCLSNYASILIDAGHGNAALEIAGQALAIRKLLAQKIPARFDEEFFCSKCFVSLLNWLSCSPSNLNLDDLLEIPTTVPLHRYPLLKLYAAFVQGCFAEDEAVRTDALGNVLLSWSGMSNHLKKEAMPYWLCAAAFSSKFAPELVMGVNWQAEWQDYVLKRQRQIPKWLFEVGRRLAFQWPELHELGPTSS